ncbi:iron-containing alcohol dehydrogenase [Alkalihalophilus pseudofirmus]|uniref:iron-containing alcohol dehydrogenase n=1 Tax=Alkalihalophilus pseudofirmus TaxID=79885 RepID=UPI00259AFD1D|nr:iron-containing alcohol dehydrogenase [Alkalihalophilus pseudofirmus]WEG16913.1 iron-containing alcohol dehydrogenase [Alkalihalophilus pseudofirmus]
MRICYYRSYQAIYKIISTFLPWRYPSLLEGEGSLDELPAIIKDQKVDCLLIVTDQGIISAGLLYPFVEQVKRLSIDVCIYDKTVPNPTIQNIEEALELYHSNRCMGIVAFGGGSSIDCAKGVAARVARPDKRISEMRGQLKVKKKTPLLFAVPTTSGTGSEATLAAVISHTETQEKYAVNDPVLIPDYAVLDPLLTIKLPAHITAATGMDALTHAVEAYIGRSNTEETKQCSLQSVNLIFNHLPTAYSDGLNKESRKSMQKASYLAGVAFTRAYVGYVHAIAHTLSAFYGVPHGQANAIILPHVLEYYGSSVYKPLAELADAAEICASEESDKEKAVKFIRSIKELNAAMNIPDKVSDIKEEDIPLMVERAHKEANPLYPVPKILLKDDLTRLYHLIKE